jgi:hypothetical protein
LNTLLCLVFSGGRIAPGVMRGWLVSPFPHSRVNRRNRQCSHSKISALPALPFAI